MITTGIVAAVWVVLTAIALFFNHACSVVSGNHEDPHRDDGQ